MEDHRVILILDGDKVAAVKPADQKPEPKKEPEKEAKPEAV